MPEPHRQSIESYNFRGYRLVTVLERTTETVNNLGHAITQTRKGKQHYKLTSWANKETKFTNSIDQNRANVDRVLDTGDSKLMPDGQTII